jgi:hypothetical protein
MRLSGDKRRTGLILGGHSTLAPQKSTSKKLCAEVDCSSILLLGFTFRKIAYFAELGL